MPGREWNDRSFYVDASNKPLRLSYASWLEPTGAVMIFEDFLMDALADSPYVTVNQSGTATTAAAISATAGAPTAGHGGWLAGATDNVDAEIDEIAVGGSATAASYLVPERAGSGMLVCEWGFVIPTALTARQYFVGLSDDPTEGTTTNGPINIQTGTTLVAVADDAAGFIFSSLATDADGYYAASVDSTTASTIIAPTVTGVVDDYTRLRVEIDSTGEVYFYSGIHASLGGSNVKLEFQGGPTNVGVTPTVALVPIFTAAATTTTAVPWEIDYVLAACSR